MKKNDTTKSTLHDIPDIDIIDLDKDPIDGPEDDNLQTDDHTEEYEDYEEKHASGFIAWLSKAKWHLAFLGVFVGIIVILVIRILNYGVRDDLDNYEGYYERDNFDNILPLFKEEGMELTDDGVTTIVAFGNGPFADDKGQKGSLEDIIEDKTGAVIHNFAISGSYLADESGWLGPDDEDPMDSFSLYWMAAAFCMRNAVVDTYEAIFEKHADTISQETIDTFHAMMELDFNTVDVIVLMYDASDYLAGHKMYDDFDHTDIHSFTGNMEAGIELIQETYPHIRIIVMSPTYAFAINEQGEYVSSDQYRYGQDVLSTYVIKLIESAYHRQVTIIDHLYGTIAEDNAHEYLSDNLHLNAAGRELVADRFIYALTYYD